MPTDKELRDAAVVELKLTTSGWRKSNGNPNYPSGTAPASTHWGKAMPLLAQIGQVTPLPALELPSSLTATAFAQAVASAPAGPVLVRPAAGSFFTVTGKAILTRPNVTLERGEFVGGIEFAANGCSLVDSWALVAHIYGADDITWLRSVLDGKNLIEQCFVMPKPGTTDGARRFRVLDCTLQNFYVPNSPIHSEALYIGGLSEGGEIRRTTFRNNGNTAHVFFTYWGAQVSQHPRNWKVQGSRFETYAPGGNTLFAIQHREEIPASSNICIDPDNVTNLPYLIGNETGPSPEFVRPCQ